MILKELKLNYVLLTDKTINILNKFIEVSNILYILQKNIKNSFSDISEKDLKNYLKQLNKFSDFSFIKEIIININSVLEKLKERDEKKIIKKYDNILKYKERIEKSIKSMNFNSVKNIDIISDFFSLQELIKSESKLISQNINFNFIKSSLSFIFSGGRKEGLLSSFTSEDWVSLNKRYFRNPIFNYLDLINENSTFHEFVYYISKLKDDKQEIELNNEEFQDYIKLLYKNDDRFKKFKNFVDKYLHENNKKLIPTIITFLDAFPIIKKENEESKNKIKVVYRGINISSDNPNYKKILRKQNIGNRYVATSISKLVAEDFSIGLGGVLFKPSSSGVIREGLLLTYSTNSSSIILDFNIMGSLYGEGEVLIDSKKSKIINVEKIRE